MSVEQANEASQSDVGFDDLYRAAEEARAEDRNEQQDIPTDVDEKQPSSPTKEEPRSEEPKQAAKEKEPEVIGKEAELEGEVPPEPKDNKERSQLGRKVASLENQLKLYERQFDQMNQQLTLMGSMFQNAKPPTQEPEPEEEYLPSTPEELNNWFERKLQRREQQMMQERSVASQQEQAQRQKYEISYLATLEDLGQSEDDIALHEEAYRLSTEPGAPFNEFHTGDAKKDAKINYLAAKGHVLKQKFSEAAKSASHNKPPEKKNPLKGEPPKAPIGAPSATPPPSRAAQPVKLDGFARNAARRLMSPITGKPYSDKELAEIFEA